MAVAPPLILLGAPFRSFVHGLPTRFDREGLAGFCVGPSCSGWTRSGLPMFCWLAATVALIGWHVPVAFELGMRSNLWHEVEYACFFGTGLLFWWPVIRPWPNIVRGPRWSIVLYLFFATMPCDMLSAFLTFCDRVVYPCYCRESAFQYFTSARPRVCGRPDVVCVTFVYLVPAVVITTQLLSTPGAHDPNPDEVTCPKSRYRHWNGPGVEVV